VTADLLQNAARRRAMAAAAREYACTRRWDLALSPVYDAYRAAVRDATLSAAVHHAA